MIEPEDLAWFVRWAQVLHKIRNGASGVEPVVLTPGECTTLARGIDGLSQVERT